MKLFLTCSSKLDWLHPPVPPFQQVPEIKVLHENEGIQSGDILNLFKEYDTYFLILILWIVIHSCQNFIPHQLLLGPWHNVSMTGPALLFQSVCIFVHHLRETSLLHFSPPDVSCFCSFCFPTPNITFPFNWG